MLDHQSCKNDRKAINSSIDDEKPLGGSPLSRSIKSLALPSMNPVLIKSDDCHDTHYIHHSPNPSYNLKQCYSVGEDIENPLHHQLDNDGRTVSCSVSSTSLQPESPPIHTPSPIKERNQDMANLVRLP
jgi:hypothetical protein